MWGTRIRRADGRSFDCPAVKLQDAPLRDDTSGGWDMRELGGFYENQSTAQNDEPAADMRPEVIFR
jgi:hypothetical protein